MELPLWLLHSASVWFMTGLIWLVQLVHYPLMDQVAPERFETFHAAHSGRITWIVLPVMLTQLGTALLLQVQSPAGLGSEVRWGCLGLSLAVFAATGLLSVPAHSRLASGFQAGAHRFLVLGNWVRTLAWTAHAALVFQGTLGLLRS